MVSNFRSSTSDHSKPGKTDVRTQNFLHNNTCTKPPHNFLSNVRHCLKGLSPLPCPSMSVSKFNIMKMVMDNWCENGGHTLSAHQCLSKKIKDAAHKKWCWLYVKTKPNRFQCVLHLKHQRFGMNNLFIYLPDLLKCSALTQPSWYSSLYCNFRRWTRLRLQFVFLANMYDRGTVLL